MGACVCDRLHTGGLLGVTLTLTCGRLQDPNTKTALFESADIIKYLNETYATSA